MVPGRPRVGSTTWDCFGLLAATRSGGVWGATGLSLGLVVRCREPFCGVTGKATTPRWRVVGVFPSAAKVVGLDRAFPDLQGGSSLYTALYSSCLVCALPSLFRCVSENYFWLDGWCSILSSAEQRYFRVFGDFVYTNHFGSFRPSGFSSVAARPVSPKQHAWRRHFEQLCLPSQTRAEHIAHWPSRARAFTQATFYVYRQPYVDLHALRLGRPNFQIFVFN